MYLLIIYSKYIIYSPKFYPFTIISTKFIFLDTNYVFSLFNAQFYLTLSENVSIKKIDDK